MTANSAHLSERISLTGARLIDPASGHDAVADLHIADGVIAAIGAPPAGFQADRRVDFTGRWLLPGVIDGCARLREPGFEYRATLDSELRAALAAGVSAVVCPPDTDPPLDEPGLVEMLRHRQRQLAGTHLYPQGALTVGLQGKVITEMAQLAEAGCVGFGQPVRLPRNTQTLLRALQYAATFGFTVWLHPQDAWLGEGGVAHSGVVSSKLGLASVPVSAETVALHTIFELVRQTGCAVHLCRLSSAAGVELVHLARKDGLPITCDVAVHHLHFIDVDIGYFDSRMRVDPPFRSDRDRRALRRGLVDGTIDMVCSDHTPVDDDSKQQPFAQAQAGVSALELLLPLVVKWATEDEVPLVRALGAVTNRAAAIIGCEGGSLAVGAPADVTVFDQQQAWIVSAQTLRSQCHHTPFSGLELLGRGRVAVIGGRWVDDPDASLGRSAADLHACTARPASRPTGSAA